MVQPLAQKPSTLSVGLRVCSRVALFSVMVSFWSTVSRLVNFRAWAGETMARERGNKRTRLARSGIASLSLEIVQSREKEKREEWLLPFSTYGANLFLAALFRAAGLLSRLVGGLRGGFRLALG